MVDLLEKTITPVHQVAPVFPYCGVAVDSWNRKP